jgi:ribosomal protein S27E
MTKVSDVVRFLEGHSWKVIASTEPYGEQKTTFARFRCTKCKAEWVSFASNPETEG